MRLMTQRVTQGALAVLLILPGLATELPAHADDLHPAIFTFEAHRTTGDLVAFSGQYATWDSSKSTYAAASDGVEVEDNAPGTSRWQQITSAATDSSGFFSGLEHVEPARSLRATDMFSMPVAVSTTTASVSRHGPLISTFATLQAYRPSRRGSVQISGSFGGWAAFEPQSGAAGPLEGMTEYASPTANLLLQWKARGVWKTIAHLTTNAKRSGRFSLTVAKPLSSTWRIVQPGNAPYTKLTSTTFRTSSTKFVGN